MGLWSAMRVLRAAGFAATCAVLAAAAHVTGGGMFSARAVLAGFLVIVVPAWVVTGRERTLGSILPATAASQVVLHVLMSQAVPHHQMTMADSAPVTDGMACGMGGSPTLGMLLMHALGILLTSAWLEWGEARLCAVVRQVVAWLRWPRPLRPAGQHPPPFRIVPCHLDGDAAPIHTALRHIVVRRGPPGVSTA